VKHDECMCSQETAHDESVLSTCLTDNTDKMNKKGKLADMLPAAPVGIGAVRARRWCGQHAQPPWPSGVSRPSCDARLQPAGTLRAHAWSDKERTRTHTVQHRTRRQRPAAPCRGGPCGQQHRQRENGSFQTNPTSDQQLAPINSNSSTDKHADRSVPLT
jgi:hypothetical protein